MQANSSPIESSQRGVHHGLAQRVERALQHPWRRPVAEHSRLAFEHAQQWRAPLADRALIIDAGCGVGLSTRRLAEQNPEAVVIGIDRSEDRLARDHGRLPDNALLVRADLVDFWRLALAADWRPTQHYLLYPNPYPKPGLLKQRWQGHPVLPTILRLGGRLELRSNWHIYVEEFAQATQLVTGITPTVEPFVPASPALTPFEEKYHRSGQQLWRLQVELLRQNA
ncbi:tRNA (guanine(46)-N(7))-methyltransferase TrmB [Carnimonas nigrificans]|uniref:tRNA (guanine(46)-N(7))-methyltransferase TrmB n=1 Tax=Carnimonas nigrificans TaxID=64323 RepID=UPI00047065BE|nr:methyltransferase domain-containing protein [Carnimonas nigrificans]